MANKRQNKKKTYQINVIFVLRNVRNFQPISSSFLCPKCFPSEIHAKTVEGNMHGHSVPKVCKLLSHFLLLLLSCLNMITSPKKQFDQRYFCHETSQRQPIVCSTNLSVILYSTSLLLFTMCILWESAVHDIQENISFSNYLHHKTENTTHSKLFLFTRKSRGEKGRLACHSFFQKR